MTEEKKKQTTKKEPKFNHLQACIMLKLGYYDSKVVEKKYKGEEMTLTSWKNLLKKDNLKF